MATTETGNTTDLVQGSAISAFGNAIELGKESLPLKPAKPLGERNTSLEKLLTTNNVVIFAINIDRYQWVKGYSEDQVIYRPAKSID